MNTQANNLKVSNNTLKYMILILLKSDSYLSWN